MPTSIVFETHAITEDNENGIATGWLPGRLSERGRESARRLGLRRRDDELAAVFTSDLARAVQTADLALGGAVPILHDCRLRECDYGERNGRPKRVVHGDRLRRLDEPYPGGESWRQAIGRVEAFLGDLPSRWSGRRILVIGHVATRWGLEHAVNGTPLERLAEEDFTWRPGWEYTLS